MAKIFRTVRIGGRSYRAGQERDLARLDPELLRRLEERGTIGGFTAEGGEAVDEGLSGVLIRELRTRLGKIEDPNEIKRLRGLETRRTAIQHYDVRLEELLGG